MAANDALTAAVMEDLEHPLLPVTEDKAKEETEVALLSGWKYHAASFGGGSAIGALMSILAFQVPSGLMEAMNSTQVFFYSVGAAAVTSIIAYVLFCAVTWNYNLESASLDFVDKFEVFYAIGVFLGFCTACEVADILNGSHLASVSLTVVLSLAWAGVMFFGGTRFAKFQAEKDEQETDN